MSLPRWAHHFWAHVRGYFWLPCPRCGRMFGGHETRDDPDPGWAYTIVGMSYLMTCRVCQKEGVYQISMYDRARTA